MEKAIEDVGEELMASKNVLGFIEDDIKRITGGNE